MMREDWAGHEKNILTVLPILYNKYKDSELLYALMVKDTYILNIIFERGRNFSLYKIW